MHKLAAADMQKYIDDGHQDEDEANLKKLQVESLAPNTQRLSAPLVNLQGPETPCWI